MNRFPDRRAAGMELGALLAAQRPDRPVVAGLARGGVPVAVEVARALDAPLEAIVVRKLGAPGQEELGIGAIAEGDVRVVNEALVRVLGVSESALAAVTERERGLLEQRAAHYAPARPSKPRSLEGRTAIIVDDGLATGFTARAAIAAVRARGARRIILAVPVCAPETARELSSEVDEVICLRAPEELWAIGYWYHDFGPVADEDVLAMLLS